MYECISDNTVKCITRYKSKCVLFHTITSINLVHILSLTLWASLPPGGNDADMTPDEFADLTPQKSGADLCRRDMHEETN